MDNEKLSRIKAAIENGTYEVNPEAIAEKLLAEVDGIDFQDYDQSQGEE